MFENFRGNHRKIRAAASAFGLDHTPYRTWSYGDLPEGIDEHLLNVVETTPSQGCLTSCSATLGSGFCTGMVPPTAVD